MKRKPSKRITILVIAAVVLSVSIIIFIYMLRRASKNQDKERTENHIERNINTKNLNNYYWHSKFNNNKQSEELVKGQWIDSVKHSLSKMIEILNLREPDAKLILANLQNDTVNLTVKNDTYLSERMGSAGAYNYLAETVFTLTENESIKYVHINMNYGSHAGPGVYDRSSFEYLSLRNN